MKGKISAVLMLACSLFGKPDLVLADEPLQLADEPTEIQAEATVNSRWDADFQKIVKRQLTASRTRNYGPVITSSAKLLARVEQESSERSADFITALNFHAMLFNADGRLEEARSLLARSLRLSNDVLGDRHRMTLKNLHNYAFVMDRLGNVEEAAPYYDLALRLRNEVLGEADSQTMLTRISYATVLYRIGRMEEAAQLFDQSLRISERTFGNTHILTVNSRKRYVQTLHKLGRNDEARAIQSGSTNKTGR